jgi:hypothetical protein
LTRLLRLNTATHFGFSSCLFGFRGLETRRQAGRQAGKAGRTHLQGQPSLARLWWQEAVVFWVASLPLEGPRIQPGRGGAAVGNVNCPGGRQWKEVLRRWIFFFFTCQVARLLPHCSMDPRSCHQTLEARTPQKVVSASVQPHRPSTVCGMTKHSARCKGQQVRMTKQHLTIT